MKSRTLFILMALAVPVFAIAQEREKVTVKQSMDYSTVKEVYQVLKSDKSVKDGFYKWYLGNQLIVEGFYANGLKDSIWKTYSYNDGKTVVSNKQYSHGKRIGKWTFFDANGKADWSYDFATAKAEYSQPFRNLDGFVFYVDSANGNWVKTSFSVNPLPLFGRFTWADYLIRHLHYPQSSMDAQEQGTVVVAILVDENGDVIDRSIYSGATIALNDSALELVKGFNHEFLPAEKDGKPVKVQYRVSVTFRQEMHR